MIDIVIVNWNAGRFLSDCLDSIEENSEGLVASVTVVDNGSRDGSDKYAERRESSHLIRTGQNLGFGKGCNVGAAIGDADFLLFLNPDARLLPGSLSACHEFMNSERGGRIGICGVQLLDDNSMLSKTSSRFPSTGNLIARATGLDKLVPTWGTRMVEWDHSESRKVDQVMGAFFFIRRALFEELGGFDEHFFVYFEEVDLSKRSSDAGWGSWYLADAKAMHYGGGSSENVKALRPFYSLRSRIIYSRKHFSFAQFLAVLLFTLTTEPVVRIARAMARLRAEEAMHTLKAYRLLVAYLSKPFGNRTRNHTAS